jgi:outer membrane murein-binding lipoprotein Lpp
MQPITNSPIKEAMRLQYASEAENKKNKIELDAKNDGEAIKNKCLEDVNAVKFDIYFFWHMVCYYASWIFFFLAVISAFFIGIFGFILGVIISIVFYFLDRKFNVKTHQNRATEIKNLEAKFNNDLENRKNKALRDLKAADDEADRKTQQFIRQYDEQVKKNCQNILNKQDSYEDMVNHTVVMFERMISHADSALDKKFIEAQLTFKVEKWGICYQYQSNYTNPSDDYNFSVKRYRGLNTDEECEGLAQALAKLKYPQNSSAMTVTHIDAMVTLHFKAPNKNYVPLKDIY